MAQVLSVSVNGTRSSPNATAQTVGIGVAQIRTIEPFVGTQPLTGVTILTQIRMKRDGTQVDKVTWLSVTATATVITASNA